MPTGKISKDSAVAAGASSVWQIYRGFELSHFVNKHLSDVLGTVDFIAGDGGAGSVVRLTTPPDKCLTVPRKYVLLGSAGAGYLIERFRIMDDEKRIKEAEQLEGGYLALGFNSVCVRLEIVENGSESSIIRSTIEYDIDEKLSQNASLLSLEALDIIAQAVENHLASNKASA